jgi:putative transposase
MAEEPTLRDDLTSESVGASDIETPDDGTVPEEDVTPEEQETEIADRDGEVESSVIASLQPSASWNSTETGDDMPRHAYEEAICDIRYLIVWTTRSRDQILSNDIAMRTREMIRDICVIHEAKISKGVVAPDYIRLDLLGTGKRPEGSDTPGSPGGISGSERTVLGTSVLVGWVSLSYFRRQS